MLHLLPGPEIVVPGGPGWLVADGVSAAKGGERGVRERDALSQKLLVHPYQVALAQDEQLQDLFLVRLGSTGPLQARHIGRPRGEDLPHCSPRDPQRAGDLADALAAALERQDRRPGGVIEHSLSPIGSADR